jgi:ElaA protein
MKNPAKINLDYRFKPFLELTLVELYEILYLRQQVFVVEQTCPFEEIDHRDEHAHHLMGRHRNRLFSYARIIAPGKRFAGPSIGRIITHQDIRNQGYGKELMQIAIGHTDALYPQQDIYLSAQQHLEPYYEKFAFKRCSDAYDEDGIMHVDMKRRVAG